MTNHPSGPAPAAGLRSAANDDSAPAAAHKQVLQPPGWAAPKGYANGVAASGRQVFVAGQIGWNERCEFQSDNFVDQTRQALMNVLAVLKEAKAGPQHITRMTWYVTSRAEYLDAGREVGRIYRELVGDYAVAMSAVQVVALMEPRAKVEIEVTAVVA
jgi:enamine deaminase RidA (YjgF/YER057c/UK114 family)